MTTSPQRSKRLAAELDRVTVDGVFPAGLGAMLIFALFFVFNAVTLPPNARLPMLVFDVALVLLGAVVAVLTWSGRLRGEHAHPAGALLAVAAAADVLLAMWLTGDPFYALYVAAVILPCSGLMRWPWLVATVAALLAMWLVVGLSTLSPSLVASYSFLLLGAVCATFVIRAGRGRTHARLSELLAQDEVREQALERALNDAENARASLDLQVEQRTAALRSELDARRASEQARAELELQLRHAQKLEAVGRLAGGLAHDFNNLLTVIQGSLLAAAEHPQSPEVHDALEDASEATRRASDLTRDLLAFGRKQPIERLPVSAADVVRGVDRMAGHLAGSAIRTVTRIDADVGQVLVDRGQLEQVLLNFAINACDAMPDGGTLTLSVERLGDAVCFAVEDTGTGIEPAARDRLFEPFFTTKPPGRGTGLGLAVAHGIVSQHGGTIDVQSELGRGSRFCVHLPRLPSATSGPPQLASAPASS